MKVWTSEQFKTGRCTGIVSLRRWYDQGEPKLCFVERKTHRESWKGEESVKERFMLPENKMVPYLEGEYTVDQAQADLRAKARSKTREVGLYPREIWKTPNSLGLKTNPAGKLMVLHQAQLEAGALPDTLPVKIGKFLKCRYSVCCEGVHVRVQELGKEVSNVAK